MRHRTLPLLAVACLAAVEARAQERFTLEQTLGRGDDVDLTGRLERWSWAPDGEHLLVERDDEVLWIDPRTRQEVAPPTLPEGIEPQSRRSRRGNASGRGRVQPDEDGEAGSQAEEEPLDPLAAALAAIDGIDERHARRIARGRTQSAEGGRSLIESGGELYFHDPALGARILTADSRPELELAELSPDGAWVAFVQGNDLVVLSTGKGWRRELTSDGGADVFNGKLDWVYQEEIYGRGDFKGFWWSPDSTHVAFLKLDQSRVHDFTVIDSIEHGHFRVRPEVTRYPKVGDPNPTVALGLAEVASGQIAWVDLGAYREAEPLIVRVTWTPRDAFPDGSRLLAVVQDRVQTWAELLLVDPRDGGSRRLLRESSESWVERPDEPLWLEDASFLWTSHRSGHRHLYRYGLDGELVGAVTGGDWSVVEVLEVDEQRGLLWFSANMDGAVDRNVYRIGLDGRGLRRLTQGRGWHSIDFDGERRWFLDRVSSLEQPAEVRLCDAEGEVSGVLARAEIPDLERYATSRWELVEIPARDGFVLDAALLRPVPFDEGASYPVWISTYSGPDSPSVRNRWDGGVWDQFLAQNGVILLRVNVRSASGKGHWATESCYRRLGIVELADLEDAVGWLCTHPWADAGRVGITGYSYGGFMAAYALTHSDRFALGVAGSGVYDWRLYDTIYTERYMDTPRNNPEGYERTSVIAAAANLSGHLLLHHGDMDDNVHVQNAIQLAFALQKAGRPFEMMLFPENRHGIRDPDQRRFLRNLEWRAIQEHLIAPGSRVEWPRPVPVGPEPPEGPGASEAEPAPAAASAASGATGGTR